MYGNSNKLITNDILLAEPCKLFTDGITAINTAQWLVAYSIFDYLYETTKNKSVALLYNISLCYFSAKAYSKVIATLGEALTQLASPSALHHPANRIPADLLTQEYDSNHYRLALGETTVALNTNIVKLRIRRVLIDVHVENENWQEVIRLSALPEMENCKNVKQALAIAVSKTNT